MVVCPFCAGAIAPAGPFEDICPCGSFFRSDALRCFGLSPGPGGNGYPFLVLQDVGVGGRSAPTAYVYRHGGVTEQIPDGGPVPTPADLVAMFVLGS